VAYNEGYVACLVDVLNFVQAGLSAEGDMGGGVDGGGMTIGRVMDWVEARLEATRAREEEEEEDREKERERGRIHQQGATSISNAPAPTNGTVKKSKSKRSGGNESKSGSDRDDQRDRERESETERERHALADIRQPSINQSPSPPPIPASPPTHTRSKFPRSKPAESGVNQPTMFPMSPDSVSPFGATFPLVYSQGPTTPLSPSLITSNLPQSPVSVFPPFPPIIGSKRRHASMMESNPTQTPTSSSRERDRTASQSSTGTRRRNKTRNGGNPMGGAGEPMEIEEERERKRVARR
jgi:hypothetical protein